MAKARVRQTWIKGAERPCNHGVLDEVKSFGGVVLAERCAACQLLLAQYGTCAGCGRDKRRLVHFVATTRAAYCSPDCHQASIKAAKARSAEAAEAKRAGAKGG